MHYFKRPWNETRGDSFSSWGKSIWFFETNPKGNILKQIEVYETGPKLYYDSDTPEDKYGGLGITALSLEEFSKFKITPDEFYLIWK